MSEVIPDDILKISLVTAWPILPAPPITRNVEFDTIFESSFS